MTAYPVAAIVGPTASGKSDLALSIADRFSGEIVNYDSVQIFRHFNIGTAKPSLEARRRVPHHLIDIREPSELFTAGDYQREARRVLDEIRGRKRLPVLVGGTGLYLRAVTDGLFDGPSRSLYWRNRLEAIAEKKGREQLHRLLARLDPLAASRIAPRDKPKLIRALEVRLVTGKPISEHFREEPGQPLEDFKVLMIGLNPDREALFRRIDERVCQMFRAGLVDEVRKLLATGVPRDAKPLESIGYRHVLAHLDGSMSLEEMISLTQRDTRRYAKRQMTWFRSQQDVHWFGGTGDDEEIKKQVHQHLQSFTF